MEEYLLLGLYSENIEYKTCSYSPSYVQSILIVAICSSILLVLYTSLKDVLSSFTIKKYYNKNVDLVAM